MVTACWIRSSTARKVPFRFELKINSGNTTRKSVALTLQDELRKHGIDASVREIDWTIFSWATSRHESSTRSFSAGPCR